MNIKERGQGVFKQSLKYRHILKMTEIISTATLSVTIGFSNLRQCSQVWGGTCTPALTSLLCPFIIGFLNKGNYAFGPMVSRQAPESQPISEGTGLPWAVFPIGFIRYWWSLKQLRLQILFFFNCLSIKLWLYMGVIVGTLWRSCPFKLWQLHYF